LRFIALTQLLGALIAAACYRGPAEHVFGVYAHDSRALLRLDHDYDGDGRIDVRTYMRDGRPVRLEADTNRDNVIDRWEYYGPSGELLRIGGATQGDGHEDTWARLEGNRRLIDIATARDGRIDRREVYEGEALVHAQLDTNGDGLPDRWEEFRDGALVRVLIDHQQRHGRPTRRIVYGAGGTARIEADDDGDETWAAIGGAVR
jgi:hypothetical protein